MTRLGILITLTVIQTQKRPGYYQKYGHEGNPCKVMSDEEITFVVKPPDCSEFEGIFIDGSTYDYKSGIHIPIAAYHSLYLCGKSVACIYVCFRLDKRNKSRARI